MKPLTTRNIVQLSQWNYYVYLAKMEIVKTRIIKGKVFIETKHSLMQVYGKYLSL